MRGAYRKCLFDRLSRHNWHCVFGRGLRTLGLISGVAPVNTGRFCFLPPSRRFWLFVQLTRWRGRPCEAPPPPAGPVPSAVSALSLSCLSLELQPIHHRHPTILQQRCGRPPAVTLYRCSHSPLPVFPGRTGQLRQQAEGLWPGSGQDGQMKGGCLL